MGPVDMQGIHSLVTKILRKYYKTEIYYLMFTN